MNTDYIESNSDVMKAYCNAMDLANLGVIAPHKAKYINRYNINWLIDEVASGKKLTYVTFWQADEGCENRIFCQWYPHPFMVNGRKYDTAEQYMMSEKALLFGDLDSYSAIMNEPKLSLKVLDCVKTYKATIAIGVSCAIDSSLMQNYKRVMNCGYIEK